MKVGKGIVEATSGRKDRAARKSFIRSLEETAVRAVVTATVTFAVGLVLKKMFVQSVADAAQAGAKSGVDEKLSQGDLQPAG